MRKHRLCTNLIGLTHVEHSPLMYTHNDRTAERRTLSTVRWTASSPLLANLHTSSIIPFPSTTPRISPSEYNLNNHSSVDFMTFAESESRANRRGYKMNSTLKFDNPNTNEFEFRFEESERVSILSSTNLYSQPNNTHSLVMHVWTTSGGSTRISVHGWRPESPKR